MRVAATYARTQFQPCKASTSASARSGDRPTSSSRTVGSRRSPPGERDFGGNRSLPSPS